MSRPYANENAFRALADPTRRRIIDLLRKGDHTVIDMAESIGCSLPTLSHHLGILRTTGVITHERKGRKRLYTLNAASLRGAAGWLRSFA